MTVLDIPNIHLSALASVERPNKRGSILAIIAKMILWEPPKRQNIAKAPSSTLHGMYEALGYGGRFLDSGGISAHFPPIRQHRNGGLWCLPMVWWMKYIQVGTIVGFLRWLFCGRCHIFSFNEIYTFRCLLTATTLAPLRQVLSYRSKG